ncbi:hypothetical protein [Vulcanisaeta sp. JCM 16159]|uniref:hypothetical protein n=1 Tax=Vulcanisaeta sp. JCM 16159 TaxID=1295371 RepID=UPI000AB95720|nr:hypothetical protein [Vulcanisaeta sp. JCM 16159]
MYDEFVRLYGNVMSLTEFAEKLRFLSELNPYTFRLYIHPAYLREPDKGWEIEIHVKF